MTSNSRKAAYGLMVAVLCLWLSLAPAAAPAVGFPLRAEGSWSDDFDSTEGIRELHQTRITGETLRLAEADIKDLGVAVPGESAVHAVIGTTLGENGHNVYCGTGDRGHLVEHDPDEVYQEGFEGPTHRGVSNSRGQPWATAIETSVEDLQILSLVTDGTQYVYGGTGGTYPDGSLVRFEPYDGVGDHPVQRPIENLGVAVAGGGDVLALTYNGASVFGGTANGNLFYYDGSFTDLGACPGTSGGIKSLTSIGPTIYGGTVSGDLFAFDGGFTYIGPCPGTTGAIESLASDGAAVYGGTADGDVFSYNGAFNDLGNPAGTGDVNALAVSGTDLFIGSEDGHVYVSVIGAPGVFEDQGLPANSGGAPISALSPGADGNVYGGTANGRLFRQSGFEDHDPTALLPGNPITGFTQVDRTVYLSDDAGYLYSYTGPGEITSEGRPNGDDPINDIDSLNQTIYMGLDSGELWGYYYGSFEYRGTPAAGTAIETVLVKGSTVYLGLGNGKVFAYDGSSFNEIADVPGTAVTDLLWVDGLLFIAAADGNLYSRSLRQLNGAFTLDASNTWMVGHDGNIIYEGANRSVKDSGTDENLNGVFAFDTSHAWAVGNQGAVTFYDGSTWSVQTSGTTENLTGACAVSATEAWAVGWEGTVLHTTNGGADWSAQPSGTASRLRGVCAAGANNAWAVGDGGTILFQNGSAWTAQASGTTAGLKGVCAASATEAWAVGDGGTILHTSNGTDWTAQESGTTDGLNGVCAESATEAWAVGDNGTILFFDGATWSVQGSGVTTEHLRGVSAANAAQVWAVGENGTIVRYDGSWEDEGLYDHGSPDGSALNSLAEYRTVIYAGMEGNEIYSFDGGFNSVGDCGSHVKSLAPGNQGVLAGTDDGHLWIYDGVLRDGGTVPDSGTVGTLHRIGESVFGGTATGGLFSHEDAFLSDEGQQVEKQVMAYCMTGDEGVIYAGTYRNAHFLVIDTTNDTVWDRGRAVNGEREIEDIAVTAYGTVYGGTYAGTKDVHNPGGGCLFKFDPLTGGFTNLGKPPEPAVPI